MLDMDVLVILLHMYQLTRAHRRNYPPPPFNFISDYKGANASSYLFLRVYAVEMWSLSVFFILGKLEFEKILF